MWKLLLVLSLFTLPRGACAQMGHPIGGEKKPDRGDKVVSYRWLKNAEGFTICYQGRGYSYTVVGQTEIERLDTQAHELKHQEQYTRFPSCEAFDQWYATLKGRLYSESEAFAAGLCVQVKRGMDKEFLERRFANNISYWYTAGEVSPLVIIPLIRKFEDC